MPRVETRDDARIDRRTFLLTGVALATGALAQNPRLETFSQWLAASQPIRDAALQPCLETIGNIRVVSRLA
jgi:hypothetical protein